MYHKTRDGKKIKISDMDTQHLINMIKFIERKAAEGVTVETITEEDVEKFDIEGTAVLDYFGYWKYKNELNKREKISQVRTNYWANDPGKDQVPDPDFEDLHNDWGDRD